MNHTRILKRAWGILWSYKTLWVFGIILALTAGGGRGGGGNTGFQYSGGETFNWPVPSEQSAEIEQAFDEIGQAMEELFSQEFPVAPSEVLQGILGTIVAIVIALCCFFILLAIVFTILRYLSQVALIRMVDLYDASGEKVSWRQGFRLGWSRHAWRLFLIDLLIFLVIFALILLLGGFAAAPVLLGAIGGGDPPVISIIATIGLGFLFIFVMIIIGVGISIFIELVYRVCVLRDIGPIEAFRQGWALARANFLDVLLMWLILIGLRIGYVLLMIPVVLLLLGINLIISGATGAALYFAVSAIFDQTAGIVVALLVGIPLFILVFAVPLTFLEGLFQTYRSSTWTLAYREVSELPSFEVLPEGEAPPESEEPALPPAEPALPEPEAGEEGAEEPGEE